MRNSLRLKEAVERGSYDIPLASRCNTNRLIVLVYWPPFRVYADLARKHRLRYIGPFSVLHMIGSNAVELDGLPDKMPPVINTEYIHPYKRGNDMKLEEMRQSPLPPQPQ